MAWQIAGNYKYELPAEINLKVYWIMRQLLFKNINCMEKNLSVDVIVIHWLLRPIFGRLLLRRLNMFVLYIPHINSRSRKQSMH